MNYRLHPRRPRRGRVARGKWLRLVLGELTNSFSEGGEGARGARAPSNGDLIVLFVGLYSDLMDYEWDIPSGRVKMAIEHGGRNSEFIYPMKNGGSFHSNLSLPEGKSIDIFIPL